MEPYVNPVLSGCIKKRCPCRLWAGCERYVDKTAQEWRLKYKQLDSEVSDYYQDRFSDAWCMHDLYSSG